MTWLKRRILAFRYALKGWKVFFQTQVNARIHALAVIIVTGAGIYFELGKLEWCLIILAIGLVLAAEAINTAIEFLVDLLHPGRHEKAGRIKDIAAGAVLFSALAAFLVGLLVFGGKALERWF